MMQRRRLAACLTAAFVSCAGIPAAIASGSVALTIYHASDDSLFSGDASGSLDSGYSVVHESRSVDLQAGRQTLRIGGLPASVDPEAVMLGFPGNAGVKILGRRIVLSRGDADSALAGHVGEGVIVVGNDGRNLANGTLLAVDSDGLTVRGADGVSVVHDYATVTLQSDSVAGGGGLVLSVDAASGGARSAQLSYTTSGIGWRAAYAATLAGGASCRMHFDPQASIANRSGRDYDDATIKLVAGQPNLASPPRMFAAKAMMAAAPAPEAMPQQRSLGDYRSFTLPGAVVLPNGTVTLTPLYPAVDIDCTREYLLEAGGGWRPPKPMLDADFNNNSYQDQPIAATLRFSAPEALPAGTLRASTIDQDGASELLGQGDIPDTPKGGDVSVTLGQSFDLRASRERTAFTVDKAAHTMEEAFRITLSNGGDAARTVTVREHPDRWRAWSLLSSSVKPAKQTPDTLQFAVDVPAHGSATLDYRVRYTWTSTDE